MNVHRDVSDIVNNKVLRDVIQIHGMSIPYPAELWKSGICQHEHGTVMFSIGERGLLTAEYFGYDNDWGALGSWGLDLDAMLVIKGTQVAIPVWISHNPKTSIPGVVAYNCEIRGRLGDPDSKMNSVSMTIAGLPDVHLFRRITHIPEESTAVEHLTMRGFKKQTGLLTFGAGDWDIELWASYEYDYKADRPLYHVKISRKDGEPFVLGDDLDDSIIDALRRFLSFQCARWIDIPTIICNPVFSTIEKQFALREGETREDVLSAVRKCMASDGYGALDELNDSLQKIEGFEDVAGASVEWISIDDGRATILFCKGDRTVKLAWVGRLSSRGELSDNTSIAADVRKWPSLFEEFWSLYNESSSRELLINALYHYFEAERVYETGSIGQALVAAQSTLQALTRWWNDLDINFRFPSDTKSAKSYRKLVIKAVEKADLGKDSGVVIDETALMKVIEKTAEFRNAIDHGAGIKIEQHMQGVSYLWAHHHNLARLLILAKLGSRDRDARGCFAGPMFLERPHRL